MMMGKQDLGLSLSLSFPHNHHSLQLNLNPSSPNSSSSPSLQNPSWNDTVSPPSLQNPSWNDTVSPPSLQNPSWNDTVSPSSLQNPSWNDAVSPPSRLHADPNSDSLRADTIPFLRGIDVNRLPSTVDCEEEAGVSSPNSTISTVSGKRSEREANRSICSDEYDEDDDTSRKKLRLSKDQSAVLEESFKEHNTLNPKQKLALAKKLGLRPRQVEVWFQNRRARTKLKQTEVDCEFLKRCYDKLTNENRRLQKEVMELRALKHSPQFYMQMTPPTTLTMCPSCKKVSVPPNASSSSTVDPRSHHLAQTFHRPIPINPFGALHPSS